MKLKDLVVSVNAVAVMCICVCMCVCVCVHVGACMRMCRVLHGSEEDDGAAVTDPQGDHHWTSALLCSGSSHQLRLVDGHGATLGGACHHAHHIGIL